jgi:hypothetical protein
VPNNPGERFAGISYFIKQKINTLDVQEEYGGYSILLLFTKFVLE